MTEAVAAKTTNRSKMLLGGTPGRLVRFSYLHVHEQRMNQQNGKLEYALTVLIPKSNTEDISAVKRAVEALKKATWADKGKPVPPGFWNPLRDGDHDTKQSGEPLGAECKGHYVLNCKSDQPPGVVGTTKDSQDKFVAVSKTGIKSGDWGRVSVNLYVYTKGLSGVGVGLNNVQLVRQGDALGSRTAAEDDFAGFAEMDESAMPDFLA